MNSNYHDFVNICIGLNICLCVNGLDFTYLERWNNKVIAPIKSAITKFDSHSDIIIGLLFIQTPDGNASIVLHVLQLQKLKNIFAQQQRMHMDQMVLNQANQAKILSVRCPKDHTRVRDWKRF